MADTSWPQDLELREAEIAGEPVPPVATSSYLNRPLRPQAEAALFLIDRADTCLERAEESSSLPHHAFGEAETLLRRAAELLRGCHAFLAQVAAEQCAVAREAYPSGASALPSVRALSAAVRAAS